MRATVINATSYFGLELTRLISAHPGLELVALTARSQAGRRMGQVFPQAATFGDGSVAEKVLTERASTATDVVFSCLPHQASIEALYPFVEAGVAVVDVSADLRLADPSVYEHYYGAAHPRPDLLPAAVYGLPELHRAEISASRLVGNPGCYPTAAILAAAPALAAELIEPDLIVDAKSGVSGAGRALKVDSHYSEVAESVHAYGVDGHRHVAEMVQEMSLVARQAVDVTFVPHLTPMVRGILSTGYARLRRPIEQGQVERMYADFFSDCPFTIVLDQPPRTKWVTGSNYCAVHARVSANRRGLLMFGAIDNLIKGAAGQALQNANLMLGIDERSGLSQAPSYP